MTPTTREQLRSRRKREVRATTTSRRQLSLRVLAAGAAVYPEENYWRPRTRGECANVERPCPYVACKHHLYLDVGSSGSIKLNFPDLEPDELVETCSLDIADRGGVTLEEVGALMNLTRERVRQLEVRALARGERADRRLELELRSSYVEGRPVRRLPVLQEDAC